MKKIVVSALFTLLVTGVTFAQHVRVSQERGEREGAASALSVSKHQGRSLAGTVQAKHTLEKAEASWQMQSGLKEGIQTQSGVRTRPAQLRDVSTTFPTIDELVGQYTMTYQNALNGNDKSGTKLTFEKSSDMQVTVSGLQEDYTVTAEYDAAAGTLTFQPTNLYLYQAGTYVQFTSWTTSGAVLATPFTATWDGSGFAFSSNILVGVGAVGVGWFWLGGNMAWTKVPDGDFSAGITMEKSCFVNNVIPFGVNVGADAAGAKYYLIRGAYPGSSSNYSFVASSGDDIKSGQYNFNLSVSSNYGVYTLFVVTVDADGAVVEGATKWFFVQEYSNDNWTSRGLALYSDDIIYGAYGSLTQYAGSQWGVEVQESKATPGLYRLVDLYGENSIFYDEEDELHEDHSHYVTIDATTPSRVVIEDSPLGIQWDDEDGDWIFSSLQNGTLADNTITFPTRGLLFTIAAQWEAGDGWYGNTNGKFKIELPGQLTVTVTDANGNALPQAVVTVAGSEVATDEDGQAVVTVHGAGADDFSVGVQKEGYTDFEITVDFKTDGRAAVEVVLTALAEVSQNGYTADLTGVFNVTLDRDFKAGWNTVCLPFAVRAEEICEGAVAQAFVSCDEAGLNFAPVEAMEANTPYLIYCPEAVAAGKEFKGVTLVAGGAGSVAQGDFTFSGTYEATVDMVGKYGVATLDGVDKVTKGAASSTLHGTRAYFTTTRADVQSIALNFLDGDATGIAPVAGVANRTMEVYTLSGVQLCGGAKSLEGLQKGIYIVNGKKQVIK
ncbi:MAG: Ig-like domain-containing protein [Clostridium sp.]|nr:Ig-like domain-containing protein [Clostridium sp.]